MNLKQKYWEFKGKVKKVRTKFLTLLVIIYYNIKKFAFRCKNINFPKEQCIFALWHAHQCGVYAIRPHKNNCIMISKSKDGDIVAGATSSLGINVVRGSSSRGGVGAAMELIDKIKEGKNASITIDGPRGPKHVVKKGIIEIARLTGVPIVPFAWYSTSIGFLKFKTWDEFCFPLNFIPTVGLYGEPIHIPPELTKEEAEFYRLKVENALKELNATLVRDYDKLLKS